MASESLTLVGIALLVVGIMLLTQRSTAIKEVVIYQSWPLHPQSQGGRPVYYSPLPLRPIVF